MKSRSRIVLATLIIVSLLGMRIVDYVSDRQHDLDRSAMYQVYSAKEFIHATQRQLELVLEYWEEIQNGVTEDRMNELSERIQRILNHEAGNAMHLDIYLSKIDLLNPSIVIDLASFHDYLYELSQAFDKTKVLTENDVENLNKIIKVGVYMGPKEFYVEQNLFNSVPNPDYLKGFHLLNEITGDMTVGEGDFKLPEIIEIEVEQEQFSDSEISELSKMIVAYLRNVPTEVDRKYGMKMYVLVEFLYEHSALMDDPTIEELIQVDSHLDGAIAESYAATLLKLLYDDPKRFISIAAYVDPEKHESIQSFIAYSASYSRETCMQLLSEVEVINKLDEKELLFLQELKKSVENFAH